MRKIFYLLVCVIFIGCGINKDTRPFPDIPIGEDYDNALHNLSISYQGNGTDNSMIYVYGTNTSYLNVVGAVYDTVLISPEGQIYMYLLDPFQVAYLNTEATIGANLINPLTRTCVMWDVNSVNLNVYGSIDDFGNCQIAICNYWELNTNIYRNWYAQLNIWLQNDDETALENFDPMLDVTWATTNISDDKYTGNGTYSYNLTFDRPDSSASAKK